MQKEKTKNDSFWQAGTLPFVALWAGSYAVAWGLLIFLFENVEVVDDLTSTQANVFAISTIMLVTGLLHVQVVQRMLKQSMRGWMLYTLIGTIITFFTFRDVQGDTMGPTTLTILSLLLPTPLIQTRWLWKRVRAAWLWPLASLVACLVFALPLRGSTAQFVLIVAALLHGLIQGGVMRYLWTQARDTKSKVHQIDGATDEERARLQRLQENEAALRASISDDSGSQHRSQRF